MLDRTVLAAALALVTLTLLAAPAQAVHWPLFGGDAGRSGYQPVDERGLPIRHLYSKTDSTEQDVVTSIITSAGGSPSIQRLVFGTESDASAGSVHQQVLEGGDFVGSEAGTDVDEGANDEDTFTGEGGSVSFADSSGPGGLGQVYVVHNDDDQDGENDISIAQIDEESGLKVREVAVPDTDTYTISSSPVLTPADEEGNRTLLFVAQNPEPLIPGLDPDQEPRLFKVQIADAAETNAQIAFPEEDASVVVDGANPLASPTLVNLDTTTGPVAHVAVSTDGDNTVQTFKVDDLAPGPKSGDLGGEAQTVSVPVQSNGAIPSPAPALYVAVEQGSGNTVSSKVYRLRHEAIALSTAPEDQSPNLTGAPAPALAVTQEADQTNPPTEKVILTTGRNLYILNANQLANAEQVEQFSATNLTAGSTGFSRTTAAASGGFVYVTRDDGEQLVIDLQTADRVPESTEQGFVEDVDNANSTRAFGQPSISRGFIQFASDMGVFVYRNTPPPPPPEAPEVSVTNASITEGDTGTATATFTVTLSGTTNNEITVPFSTADRTATAGTDYVSTSGEATFPPGETADTFSVNVNADRIDEVNEDFLVNLGDPEGGAEIADGQGTGTIVDDDQAFVSIDNVAVTEGNAGTAFATFSVSLSTPSSRRVTVNAATADQTAAAGSDYESTRRVVTFAPGETRASLPVGVLGDGVDEPNETFAVDLTNPTGEAEIASGRGVATITDDDEPPPVEQLRPGPCANTLRASEGPDIITGSLLGDSLFGLGGADSINGLEGDDCLYGGDGTDRLTGAEGNDRLDGDAGNDTLDGSIGRDRLNGGAGNDKLGGGSGSDRLNGGAGRDKLSGGTGNDRLLGGSGNDTMEGGQGRNSFSAGSGNDIVNAADGKRETVSCGAGRDTARLDRTDRARGCERILRRR